MKKYTNFIENKIYKQQVKKGGGNSVPRAPVYLMACPWNTYLGIIMYIRGRDRMVVGCWSYNYLCKQCLSPLMLWVRISISARCTTLCDKVCHWLATGRWFSPGSPVYSSNKTDRRDITEILLKVALNTIKQTNKQTNNTLSSDLYCLVNIVLSLSV